MLLPNAIKLRINNLLKENNLSEYKSAYKSDISPPNINDILRRKISEPILSTLLHIC